MPKHSQPPYRIEALTPPADWNPPGLYETKSTLLDAVNRPIEWRAHSSAANLDDSFAASKILNFHTHMEQHIARHGHPNDYWAAYNLTASQPGRHKLIIHQSAADRLPTLYVLPADAAENAPIALPGTQEPITQRA